MARRGLRATPISSVRRQSLRIQIGWGFAGVGRIEAARLEASACLATSALRESALRRIPALLLLSVCHLHRGQRGETLRDLIEAWTDSEQTPAILRADCRRFLIDAALDLDLHPGPVRISTVDLVARYPEELTSPLAGRGPVIDATNARSAALLAESQGDLDRARDLLVSALPPEADRLGNCLAASRYYHHLGRIERLRGSTGGGESALRSSLAYLRQAIRLLDRGGFVYFQARSLFECSKALRLLGSTAEARTAIARVIHLARRVHGSALLEEALRWRTADTNGP
jgi:hypothetical protein